MSPTLFVLTDDFVVFCIPAKANTRALPQIPEECLKLELNRFLRKHFNSSFIDYSSFYL
jgi:hypothetical protein